MLERLLTEQLNPASAGIDSLPTERMLEVINREDQKVAEAVAREIPSIARAIDAIVDKMERGGRLFYVGAGTSGRLGVLDASECPPTFSVPATMVVGVIAGGYAALVKSAEGAEDDVNAGGAAMDAAAVTNRDIVIGIAASGTTPYVRMALSRAQTLGAKTVLVTCSTPPQVLVETCDVIINPIVGSEVLTGSTRLKAGTATKLVLNMLTTGAMVRLGKTFGNLMVDMRATNEKLRARANRIVRSATGLEHAAAEALLD